MHVFCRMCVLGKRLLKDINLADCNKTEDGPLHKIFCVNSTCDPYYLTHNVSVVRGIKGLSSGVLLGITVIKYAFIRKLFLFVFQTTFMIAS